jgi:hypothetical protein
MMDAEPTFQSQRFLVTSALPINGHYGSGSSRSGQSLSLAPRAIMPPPPVPSSSVPVSEYTANHLLYNQHRQSKIASLASPFSRMAVVSFALHHLKAHGKSGTILVGVRTILALLLALVNNTSYL